jgi:ribosomal protein S18 acetylase RimI-like enzyme
VEGSPSYHVGDPSTTRSVNACAPPARAILAVVIRTLTPHDFPAVHDTFVEAFSDYVVPMAPAREQLGEMFQRRGAVMDASVAAFEDDRIVAFTINCIDGTRGYDTGTGVVPSHRRRGLARELMLRSFDVLRERGCSEYVLEVLEQNEKAVALYRDCGFVETRRLQCWTFDRDIDTMADGGSIHEEWWSVAPSWQNATGSIQRASDRFVAVGNDDAYAIVFPSNGDLPQLAVRPEARRAKLGTRLLEAAAHRAGKALRILNVDDRDDGIARFLDAAGARRTVRQIELSKLL